MLGDKRVKIPYGNSFKIVQNIRYLSLKEQFHIF